MQILSNSRPIGWNVERIRARKENENQQKIHLLILTSGLAVLLIFFFSFLLILRTNRERRGSQIRHDRWFRGVIQILLFNGFLEDCSLQHQLRCSRYSWLFFFQLFPFYLIIGLIVSKYWRIFCLIYGIIEPTFLSGERHLCTPRFVRFLDSPTTKNYSLIMWRLLFDPKIRKPGSNSGLLKKKIEFLYEKHWNFEYLWLHILVSVWTFTSCGGIHQLRLHISYLFMIYWKYHISLWLLCILSQYFFRWVLIRQSRNYFQLFFSEFLDFPGVPSFV